MSFTQPQAASPIEVQHARAARLRELFEPWSHRKLATRVGLTRSIIASRMAGDTPLTMPDIEVLAPVIRMSPAELFIELEAIKSPLGEVTVATSGPSELPHLDSNQEPTGYPLSVPESHEPTSLDAYRERRTAKPSAGRTGGYAAVTAITSAAANSSL